MKKTIGIIDLAGACCLPVTTAAQEAPDSLYHRLVGQAMDYTLKDSLKQAEQLFREALKLDPTNARNALLFSNLGTVLRRQGRADEAIEAYTMALNITPYSTAMLLNRASLYMEKGREDLAYVDYCTVIDLLPDEIEARLVRAYIYQRRRQYKAIVVAMSHHKRSHQPGGHAPGRGPDVLLLTFLVRELHVTRLGEVLSEKMRGTGL